MTIAQDISFILNTGTVNHISLGCCSLVASSTGCNNIALGYSALRCNTTGSNNFAAGCLALCSNITGNNNVAVGTSALGANTAGCNNIAIGTLALRCNTTGSDNIAQGCLALRCNTTGSNNVALGYSALANNTFGSNNFAAVCQSLGTNTTGCNNIAIGYGSLYNNTTGINNVALGCAALYSNTFGFNNYAIGYAALQVNSTGCNNIAIGQSALAQNTSASGNVAMGQGALIRNTTGYDNIAIGCCAGGGDAGGSSGYQNIALGRRSLFSIGIGGNNVAIGYGGLKFNTSGCSNIAIGCGALCCNTIGNNNIAIGCLAGGCNTTGSSNIAIGCAALFCNTSGSRNIGIGTLAGCAITVGACNVVIGSTSSSEIATSNCYVVIADGAGTVRQVWSGTGALSIGPTYTNFGTAGQVLCSNGPMSPPAWATVSAGGGSAAGNFVEAGLFSTSVSNQVGYSVPGDSFTTTYITTGTGIIATMPSTTGTRYIIHSLHITNTAASDAEITGRFEHTMGTGGSSSTSITIDHVSFFASRLPVPSGSAVELFKKPQILYPNDIVRLQATSANGGGGVNNQLFAYMIYESSTDYTYQSGNYNLASASPANIYTSQLSTGTTTATAYPSIIESVRVTNYSNVADYRITVFWTNSANVIQSYLAYNMLIPAYSTVEILEKVKRITSGDIIKAVPEAPNVLSIQVSSKILTSTFI